MAPSRAPSAALLRSLRAAISETTHTSARNFSAAIATREALETVQETAPIPLDPGAVTTQVKERQLLKTGVPLVGSRRRRAALAQTGGIPFNDLPYQCFQEARQILIADREQKLAQIELERARLEAVRNKNAEDIRGGERMKQSKIKSMELHLEKLKIYADINDPNVKRRFEDGYGDLSKPIYRYLADRKWREYRRKIQVQRIETMNVVPDVLPDCELEVDITTNFNGHTIMPGSFVDSATSEQPPNLKIQSYIRGERLLSIAVIDPDVPNVETDLFESRCHFLATNITISPTKPNVNLTNLVREKIVFPWLPPHSQKGSPYHRLVIVILEHRDNTPLEKEALQNMYTRGSFNIRGALTRHPVKPIGAALFRVKWDENMADVMARHGFEGANIELKRKKVESLGYVRRNPKSFR